MAQPQESGVKALVVRPSAARSSSGSSSLLQSRMDLILALAALLGANAAAAGLARSLALAAAQRSPTSSTSVLCTALRTPAAMVRRSCQVTGSLAVSLSLSEACAAAAEERGMLTLATRFRHITTQRRHSCVLQQAPCRTPLATALHLAKSNRPSGGESHHSRSHFCDNKLCS